MKTKYEKPMIMSMLGITATGQFCSGGSHAGGPCNTDTVPTPCSKGGYAQGAATCYNGWGNESCNTGTVPAPAGWLPGNGMRTLISSAPVITAIPI